MKKTVCLLLAVLLCVGAMLTGCTNNAGERPDSYSGIRWISSDYRIRFTPDDGCKGSYYYGDKKYNLRFEFDSSSVIAYDLEKKDENGNDVRFFWADWSYEDDGKLTLLHISFNKSEYKEIENDKTEFITLKQEALEDTKSK